jgi:hypothetical protein
MFQSIKRNDGKNAERPYLPALDEVVGPAKKMGQTRPSGSACESNHIDLRIRVTDFPRIQTGGFVPCAN